MIVRNDENVVTNKAIDLSPLVKIKKIVIFFYFFLTLMEIEFLSNKMKFINILLIKQTQIGCYIKFFTDGNIFFLIEKYKCLC